MRHIKKVGDKFGSLTILEHTGTFLRSDGGSVAIWKCQCDCGKVLTTRANNIEKSSACNDCLISSRTTAHLLLQRHHRSRHRHMLERCKNPENPNYENYGARGITVCERWSGSNGLDNFCFDMGWCPKGLSLDRIEVNKGYEPSNCRWAPPSIQGYNSRQHKSNTSGRTGVYWSKNDEVWTAMIMHEGTRRHLGTFYSFESAVKAREEAEIRYFGFLKSEATEENIE